MLLLLTATLALFVWGRWRYDVVSIMALLMAVVVGLVDADAAFSGFGHPAVITVAAVLIISRTIQTSGVLLALSRQFARLPSNNAMQLLIITTTVALISAFMNNVGALALMLPVVVRMANGSGNPPYRLFMPLAFASMLGGMCTLIGTPPNIIIAGYLADQGGFTLSMFDFAPVGVVVAVAGLLFMALVGWRLIPERRQQLDDASGSQVSDYISSVKLGRGNRFVGATLESLEQLGEGDFSVVTIIRRKRSILAPSADTLLRAGDLLLIESDPETLANLLLRSGLHLVASPAVNPLPSADSETMLAEVVVKQGGVMEGRTAGSLRLHARYAVNLLAISRRGRPVRQHIGHVPIRSGDLLLLQGSPDKLAAAITGLECLSLGRLDLRMGGKVRWEPLLIFMAAIVSAMSGLLTIPIAFVAAVTLMVMMRCINTRDLYASVDWPVILLLAAMMPLGSAMEHSGTAALLAKSVLLLPDNSPMLLILALLMVVTMLLSNMINNAATALLMAPIAIDIANSIGSQPQPWLIGVAIASSAAFITPIGHQSNLLVMGPGGYRFGDYWRLGLPLSLLVLIVSMVMIPWVWPF